MNKVSIISIFSLLLLIIGCGEGQKTKDSAQVSDHFDLHTVKQHYANKDFEILDISEQSYQNGSALAISLSVPIDPKTDFQAFLRVSDKQGQIVNSNWIISNNGLVSGFTRLYHDFLKVQLETYRVIF